MRRLIWYKTLTHAMHQRHERCSSCIPATKVKCGPSSENEMVMVLFTNLSNPLIRVLCSCRAVNYLPKAGVQLFSFMVSHKICAFVGFSKGTPQKAGFPNHKERCQLKKRRPLAWKSFFQEQFQEPSVPKPDDCQRNGWVRHSAELPLCANKKLLKRGMASDSDTELPESGLFLPTWTRRSCP